MSAPHSTHSLSPSAAAVCLHCEAKAGLVCWACRFCSHAQPPAFQGRGSGHLHGEHGSWQLLAQVRAQRPCCSLAASSLGIMLVLTCLCGRRCSRGNRSP